MLTLNEFSILFYIEKWKAANKKSFYGLAFYQTMSSSTSFPQLFLPSTLPSISTQERGPSMHLI